MRLTISILLILGLFGGFSRVLTHEDSLTAGLIKSNNICHKPMLRTKVDMLIHAMDMVLSDNHPDGDALLIRFMESL